jgi:hypothetical protein
VFGEPDPVAAGRTEKLADARSRADEALHACAENGRLASLMALLANGSAARLFLRVLDALDYWLMQARLWLADAVCGSLPVGDLLD